MAEDAVYCLRVLLAFLVDIIDLPFFLVDQSLGWLVERIFPEDV